MSTAPRAAVNLLAFDPITTAVTGSTGTAFAPGVVVTGLALENIFLYGSGGTTAKFWVQTSLDNGTTWIDIANFACTTAAKSRVYNLTAGTAVTSIATPGDAALADDTAVNGIFGSQFRVKYTTTGTYAGASSDYLWAVFR